jgi:hypothetical protein
MIDQHLSHRSSSGCEKVLAVLLESLGISRGQLQIRLADQVARLQTLNGIGTEPDRASDLKKLFVDQRK